MRAYILPETRKLFIIIATLCGVLVAWAGVIVYDYVTINPLAELRNLRHELELLKVEARPMNNNFDSTVNYFFDGRGAEQGGGGDE